MLKVLIDYPSLEEEQRIVRASMSGTIGDAPVTPVVNLETIRRARELVKSIYVDERIEQYVTNLVFATRYPVQYTLDQLEPYIAYGGSPRASISLALAARSLAFLNRRGYVVPDDVRSVAATYCATVSDSPTKLKPPASPPTKSSARFSRKSKCPNPFAPYGRQSATTDAACASHRNQNTCTE